MVYARLYNKNPSVSDSSLPTKQKKNIHIFYTNKPS